MNNDLLFRNSFGLWFTIDMTLAASQSEIWLTHASQFRSLCQQSLFTSKFFQILKERKMSKIHKFFSKIEKEGTFPNCLRKST